MTQQLYVILNQPPITIQDITGYFMMKSHTNQDYWISLCWSRTPPFSPDLHFLLIAQTAGPYLLTGKCVGLITAGTKQQIVGSETEVWLHFCRERWSSFVLLMMDVDCHTWMISSQLLQGVSAPHLCLSCRPKRHTV